MKFLYKDFLSQAEEKLQAAKFLLKESFYNDAVSRAYYCIFFAASALLATKGISVKSHKGLLSQFSLVFIKTGLIDDSFVKSYKIAKELREEADYSIVRQLSKEEAISVITDAEEFLMNTKEFVETI